jgi:hypothetical protein
MIKLFKQFIKESSSKNISFDGVDFGIDYELLSMLLVDITDEYDMFVSIEPSSRSSLIKKDDKSFCIVLDEGGYGELGKSVDYLEPQIFDWIETLDARLSLYGLYVSDSDYGHTDSEYEIVISFLGHKPIHKIDFQKTH